AGDTDPRRRRHPDPPADLATLAALVVGRASTRFRFRRPRRCTFFLAGGRGRRDRPDARWLADGMAGTWPDGDAEHRATRQERLTGLAHPAGADGGESGPVGGRTPVPRRPAVGPAATPRKCYGDRAQFRAVRPDAPAGAELAGVCGTEPAVAGPGAGVAAPALGIDLAQRAGPWHLQPDGRGRVVRGRLHRRLRSAMAGSELAQQARRLEQRQAHHAGIAALQMLDQCRAAALDRIATGLAERLAGGDVGGHRGLIQHGETDLRNADGTLRTIR